MSRRSHPRVPYSKLMPEAGLQQDSGGRTPWPTPGSGAAPGLRWGGPTEDRGGMEGRRLRSLTPSHTPPGRKEDCQRKRSQKASPSSRPLGSHRPWLPAAVFLIEARCGPDALGGSGGQGHTESGIPGLLPPHQGPSTGPSQQLEGWEPPTLFPGLLAPKPRRGAPSRTRSSLSLSSRSWEPLGQQPLYPHLGISHRPQPCWKRRGERRKAGKRGQRRGEEEESRGPSKLAQSHAW